MTRLASLARPSCRRRRCASRATFWCLLSHIGTFCHTSSQWSTVETSKAMVRDIMVPFFKARGAGEGVGAAQKRALLLVDVWWGWKDKGFREWIKETYPWLLLRFVPPSCTPIGQASDLGLMAKIKAGTRKGYNEWVMGQVRAHLKAGKAPEELNIKLGANMKTLISQWLGPACDVSKEEVQHYWYKVKDMELVAKSDPELRQRALRMRHEDKQEPGDRRGDDGGGRGSRAGAAAGLRRHRRDLPALQPPRAQGPPAAAQ